MFVSAKINYGCILFHFYIKPQHIISHTDKTHGCILFHFYIKPQHFTNEDANGNGCILFHFYIKPQPLSHRQLTFACCILFHFYIKPQRQECYYHHRNVVSYSISTSNHNPLYLDFRLFLVVSYSISTSNHNNSICLTSGLSLYLIPFLHQTTTIQW